ncbi:MAG: aspartate-semialdehyde dehydrogenase [Thermoplasmata archaeon]|nr:aspartate-semialdehyde dehydrogenase [Thermoplasmata archaeon]
MTDSTDRVPVAILGAGGLIGQHLVRMLAGHPRFEVRAFGGGDRTRGRSLEDLWALSEELPPEAAGERLRAFTPATLSRAGIRVAFSALPSGTAGRFESELERRGVAVFSNAADHRMDPTHPLLIPEVNGPDLARILGAPGRRTPLVTNPNCSGTGVALALAPVWSRLRPKAVHLATYQAISGAGLPGVSAYAITDNVVPYVEEEEEKVTRECRRLLATTDRHPGGATPVPFLAHAVRVGSRDGHLVAVTVEARGRPSRTDLLDAWRRFDPLAALDLPTAPHPPIVVRPEVDRPQPHRDRWAGTPARARGMAATIGRVRWEPPYLRFFVLTHNAVRGGAGAAVLNGEYAAALGYLPTGR